MSGHVINTLISTGALTAYKIYRLYVIWDFRKRVVIGPLVLLVTKIGEWQYIPGCPHELRLKIFSHIDTLQEPTDNSASVPGSRIEHNFHGHPRYLFFPAGSKENVSRCETAGRIWWVARKGSQILGPGVIRRYNIAVAIM